MKKKKINTPICNYNKKQNQVFFHKYDFGIFLYCLCPVLFAFYFLPTLFHILSFVSIRYISIVCLFFECIHCTQNIYYHLNHNNVRVISVAGIHSQTRFMLIISFITCSLLTFFLLLLLFLLFVIYI